MRKFMVSLVLFSLVALTSASLASAESPDQMIAAAKVLDERFEQAFNRNDVNGMMSLYWNNPELTVFFPGEMVARGWDEAKKAAESMFAEMPGAKIKISDQHYKPAGDVVYCWGLWSLEAPPAHGNPPTKLEGRFTDVRAKRDGKWVYIHDHASVPLPEPSEKGK